VNSIPFLLSELVDLFTGKRFGLMQVKTGLIHILSCYEVTPCKDTPVPVVFDPKSFLFLPDGEIMLSFKRT
jgi:cytochrome P450 family 6